MSGPAHLNPSVPLTSAPVEPPAQFAARGYELLAYAGAGTFADLWKVRHLDSGELRAWKQLRDNWQDDRTARRLFENEARVGRAVTSPYVVRVHDAEIERLPRFLILEWLAGETLEQLLGREPRLPCFRALWIARQSAQGLADLARAGFTHGDVKPANILVGPDGAVKLIDLGFARLMSRSAPSGGEFLAGTAEYLAPEALQPSASTGISRDLYSLGVTLYRMLCGRLPFEGETAAEVLRLQREAKPPPLRRCAPDVPREVAALVDELLAKHPLRRPQSYQPLIETLIGAEIASLQELSAA